VIGAGNEMEEKMFELMEKMYSDLTSKIDHIGKDLQEVKTEVKQNSKEISTLKNQVTKIEIEHGKKLDALFDGYIQVNSKLDRIDSQFEKIEDHEIRISVLENK
jgi:chromosome segregation ATPase